MKILSMTATFGKLKHETVTLQPGLNILEAPNEWGKSTWCAFLLAMFYGVDTRAKTTKAALAEKDHYAPWSGEPMSGRMEIEWNGRRITLERRTKGRVPMGEFRAYESDTGIAVPELTKDNCGLTLLGVERSVFARAGFIRLTDLQVTSDESLRRRLNALVTTGDDSGDGDDLEKKLRDLRNRVQHNRTGLLPQASGELKELDGVIGELNSLQTRADALRGQLEEREQTRSDLENHLAAIRYAAALEDARRVKRAQESADAAEAACRACLARCEGLPPREEAEENLRQAEALQREEETLTAENRKIPASPAEPEVPDAFRGIAPGQAVGQASADMQQYLSVRESDNYAPFFWIPAVLAGAAGIWLAAAQNAWGWLAAALGAALLAAGIAVFIRVSGKNAAIRAEKKAILDRYHGMAPSQWVPMAQEYAAEWERAERTKQRIRQMRRELYPRNEELRRRIAALAGDMPLRSFLAEQSRVIGMYDALSAARQDRQQKAEYAAELRAMAKTAEPPAREDSLTYSERETARLLADNDQKIRNLQELLGQIRGRRDALGDPGTLSARRDALSARISRLQASADALDLALSHLAEAKQQLQRRFAPRITRRAAQLMGELTGGRYTRLILSEDLSLSAGTAGEDTLRGALWRSDGTVDQLYLCLRLALAEELTPEAPLILDDALVRFDDERLKAALKLLRQSEKQILLFTCTSRESRADGT